MNENGEWDYELYTPYHSDYTETNNNFLTTDYEYYLGDVVQNLCHMVFSYVIIHILYHLEHDSNAPWDLDFFTILWTPQMGFMHPNTFWEGLDLELFNPPGGDCD